MFGARINGGVHPRHGHGVERSGYFLQVEITPLQSRPSMPVLISEQAPSHAQVPGSTVVMHAEAQQNHSAVIACPVVDSVVR